jgi:AcrR family transcriptional regulator
METRDKILLGAQELFFKFGIKSMTMDDIAKHLGMSKKTIYQFFEDKDSLVNTLVSEHIMQNEQQMKADSKAAKNAIEEVFVSLKHVNEMFSKTNPLLFHDLQKYHLSAWNIFKKHKDGCMIQIVIENLQRGIEEGLYREDINIKILAQLRLQEIEMTFNPSIFPPTQYSMLTVMEQFLKHFLLGICTLKGHRLVNKYLQITEKE